MQDMCLVFWKRIMVFNSHLIKSMAQKKRKRRRNKKEKVQELKTQSKVQFLIFKEVLIAAVYQKMETNLNK